MSKILACDLDGTLLYPRPFTTCIPRKNVEFLRKWIDQGNKVVLITSRGPEFLPRLQSEIKRPFDYIGCTSCFIQIDGKIIKNETMDNETIKDVVSSIERIYKPKAFLLTSQNYPLVIKNCSVSARILMCFYKLIWYNMRKSKENYIIDNDLFSKELENGQVYKVMAFFGAGLYKKKKSKEVNKQIREKFPQIESSWSIVLNEITPLHCTKGKGLQDYCNYLHLSPNDVYVVGDSGNDITMFNDHYENSYVMKKAYPSVKKFASHTIRRVYCLDKLLLKEKKA